MCRISHLEHHDGLEKQTVHEIFLQILMVEIVYFSNFFCTHIETKNILQKSFSKHKKYVWKREENTFIFIGKNEIVKFVSGQKNNSI